MALSVRKMWDWLLESKNMLSLQIYLHVSKLYYHVMSMTSRILADLVKKLKLYLFNCLISIAKYEKSKVLYSSWHFDTEWGSSARKTKSLCCQDRARLSVKSLSCPRPLALKVYRAIRKKSFPLLQPILVALRHPQGPITMMMMMRKLEKKLKEKR